MTWTTSASSTVIPPIQLSDGTCVVAVAGKLYWTTDRATLNLIGSLGANTALHGATLCRDASDNLYVVGLISSTIGSGYAQAWTKGTGYSWASQPEQSFAAGATWVTGGAGSGQAAHGRAYWTSTGGMGGAGQIMVAYLDTNGVVGVLTLDAGDLLNADPPTLYAATSYPTAGLSYAACVQDGFGQPSMWTVTEAGGSFTVHYFTAATSGISAGNYTTPIPGGAAGTAAGLARYAAGAAMLVYGNVAAELSPTGVIFAPDTYTLPAGISMSALAGVTYVASVGQVWVYGEQSTYNLAAFPITPGNPPTVGTTVTTVQTNGAGWMNSQAPDAILTSDFAFGQVDYLEVALNGGSYIDFGGFTVYAAAPTAATLTGPTTGAYIDGSGAVNLIATYNSADGAPANAWCARIKQAGGGYGYLRASDGTLQPTPQWNTGSVQPGASLTVTLPAGTVANGNTYNWSVAFQESYGNLQGPFATDYTFTCQSAPTLIMVGPTGTVTTSQPLVTWTAAAAAGLSITGYTITVESGAYGTTPGSGATVWSGSGTGNPGQAQVGVALANSTTYRAFVQVTETHGETSGRGYVDLPVVYDEPAVPAVTVTPDADLTTGGNPRMAVTVQARDNMLSLVDASFEGSLGSWAAVSGCTIDLSTAEALDGSYSMEMVATGTGTMTAQTGLQPCQPDTAYTIMGSFRAETVGRACQVIVAWYDNTGTFLSSTAAAGVNDITTGWGSPSTGTVTSPSNATQYRLQTAVTSPAGAGEKHLVDCALVAPGAVTAWSRGGLPGSTTVTVTRYDPAHPSGIAVRGATDVTIPSDTQQAVVYDYEAPLGVLCSYTATVTATI